MVLRRGLPRTLLLTLAALVDEADSWSYKNQMRRLYCGGWYKKSHLERSLRHLLAIGDIEKEIRNGQPVLRLTSQGNDRLQQNIPLLKLAKRRWDRWWRQVVFDIEEIERKQRVRIRYKLLELGFGQWQRSVYLSPHPVEGEVNDYLTSQGLLPRCICVVMRPLGGANDRQLAQLAWPLVGLADEYNHLLDEYDYLLTRQGKLNGSQRQELWEKYESLLFKDPFLPKELLPESWPADRVRALFQKLAE